MHDNFRAWILTSVMGMHVIGCPSLASWSWCQNSLHGPNVTCPHQLRFELDPAIRSSFQRLEYLPGSGAHAETRHISWQFTFTCVSIIFSELLQGQCLRAHSGTVWPDFEDYGVLPAFNYHSWPSGRRHGLSNQKNYHNFTLKDWGTWQCRRIAAKPIL